MLHQLVGQAVHGVLIGNGSTAGGHDDEHVVFANVFCQTRHFVPMVHDRIFASDAWMSVVDKFADECQTLFASMELDPTLQIGCHAAKTFQPAMESRFKLGS